MKPWILLLLLLICTVGFASDLKCIESLDKKLNLREPQSYLRQRWIRLKTSSGVKNFDIAEFQKTKKMYEEFFAGGGIKPATAETFEQQIALIEVILAKSEATKVDFLSIMKGDDEYLKQSVHRVFIKYRERLATGTTKEKLSDFLANLYIAVNGDSYAIKQWIKNGKMQQVRDSIKLMQKKQLATNGAIEFLTGSGLIRDPKLLERAVSYFKRSKVKKIFFTGLNVLGIAHNGLPFLAPDLRLWISFSDDVLERAMLNGFDSEWEKAIFPELYKKYGDKIQRNATYQWTKTAFNLTMTVLILDMLYENYQAEKEKAAADADTFVDAMKAENDSLKKENDSHQDMSTVEWNIYIEEYKSTHDGEFPDPNSEEYKNNHRIIFGN